MAKGQWCSETKRDVIMQMKANGQSITEISRILGCSRKMVYNAIRHFETFGVTKNVKQAPRALKTSERENKIIARISAENPFKSSSAIQKELDTDYGIVVSSRMVRRRLNANNLRGCIAQRKPLVSQKNLKARLVFAKEHIAKPLTFWKNVFWSDESKFCRFGSDGKKYVWRPKNMQHNPKYTNKTVKHGGGNVMVWAAFSWHGVGPIIKIDNKMDQHIYKNIIEQHMIPFAEEHLPLRWIFMHDNDPKHTSRLVKSSLEVNGINVLKWPAQSPDLNPIENLWNDVKYHIEQIKPKNLVELWQEIQNAWNAIPC